MGVNRLSLVTVPEEREHRPGPALKQAIHVARIQAGIATDIELARRAGVSYDTLMNWYSERTTPRPAEMAKVGKVVGLRLVDLMDTWEGRDPQPPALEEVLRELVAEIRVATYEERKSRIALEEATATILRALGVSARPAPDPRETPRRTDVESGAGTESG